MRKMEDISPKDDDRQKLMESYLKPGFIIETTTTDGIDQPMTDVMDMEDDNDGETASSYSYVSKGSILQKKGASP